MQTAMISCQQLIVPACVARAGRQAVYVRPRCTHVRPRFTATALSRQVRPFTSLRPRPQRLLAAVTVQAAASDAISDAAAQVVNKLRGTVFLAGAPCTRGQLCIACDGGGEKLPTLLAVILSGMFDGHAGVSGPLATRIAQQLIKNNTQVVLGKHRVQSSAVCHQICVLVPDGQACS